MAMAKWVKGIAIGAAVSLALAVATRFLLGGYGGSEDVFGMMVFFLGPLALALPILASFAAATFFLIRKHFPQVVGALSVIVLGYSVPKLLLAATVSAAPLAPSTTIPKDVFLVFGEDMGCYGSSACGSELIRAGYTVGDTSHMVGDSKAPVAGDRLYLTSLNNGSKCKNSGKDYGVGFGLPPECVFWGEVALSDKFVFFLRTIDPTTDAETFAVMQSGTAIAVAKRERVQIKTLSPYYFAGDLDYVRGEKNQQEFIGNLTHVELGP